MIRSETSFAELPEQKMLSSAGACVRWMTSRDYQVNASVEIALTPHDHAVYVAIGEVF